MHLTRSNTGRQPASGFLWRLASVAPLVTTTLLSASPATPIAAAAAPATCQFRSPSGAPSAIKHVVHLQFDNVHFTRDNPNVPSDLEQMPHLLNFIKNNGTLLANAHTPLIAHTTDDLITGMTGVYGDQHGIPISNSFEVYNDSSLGTYNTSAFAYWTDTVAPDPANTARKLPFQMIDSAGENLPAPWVPFVKAGCNFGAVSTANMVLENNGNDITQVFGAGSPEAAETSSNRTNDFVGIAVHCADATCSSVGSGVPAGGTKSKPELGGQGIAALYGHKYVATQVSPIATIDGGTPITGFNQANGFSPTAAYTLGYLSALLQANVPVVYGYIADAHDSRNSCASTTPTNPTVSDTSGGKPCGAYAPGEPGYVQKLHDYDVSFDQFFQKLDSLGINASNMLLVVHADENDHYAGSAPLNPGCDGIHVACQYDRTRLGEVTTDLPLLLQQQQLYDFAMNGGSGATPGTPRTGFTNTDLPYAIDFDTAPGFWLKGHPAAGSAAVRKLEGALAKVTAPNPYLGKSEQLFRFLIDEPGMRALHMISGDPDRTAGVVGFGAEDHFISTFALTFNNTSSCNRFPGAAEATCLSNSFIWLHGNFAPDINNTWAAIAGPGVVHRGVDAATFADHADLRPTMMTLLCLQDGYVHEGRAVLEDLKSSALPGSASENRGDLTALGRTFKQLNAPVGAFGKAAIAISTAAIEGNDGNYAALEHHLSGLVGQRDALVSQMETVLDKIPGCSGSTSTDDRTARNEGDDHGSPNIQQLNQRGRELLEEIQELARSSGHPESRDE